MLGVSFSAVPTRSAAHYRGRGIFLLVGAALVISAHVVDVLHARGPNWPALALRAVWAAFLAVNGVVVLRMHPSMFLVSAVDGAATAVLYLALLVVTGGSASPLFVYSYPLLLLVPVLMPELLGVATASSALLACGTFALLLRDRTEPGTLLAWGHVAVVSLVIGSVVGRASHRTLETLDREQQAREAALSELEEALQNVKTLSGLLPICMHCKRIRDDRGYWEKIEAYISTRTDASFSHGLCPECFERHYAAKTGPGRK